MTISGGFGDDNYLAAMRCDVIFGTALATTACIGGAGEDPLFWREKALLVPVIELRAPVAGRLF